MPMRRPIRSSEASAGARLALALLAAAAAVALPIGSARAIAVDDYCADPEEQTFLNLVNEYRGQNGLGPLALSQSLGATAENHSLDMAANSYFSHTALDGSGVGDRLQSSSYTDGTYGENIAAGIDSAAEAFAMWQASPSHNANMLQDDFSAIGVGRAYEDGSGYGWYWTTVFGGELDTAGVLCGGRASTEIQNESANASTTDLLNLRAGAGPDNAVLGIVPNNARIQVIGPAQAGYLPATYGGQTGWVLAEEVVLDGAPPATTVDSAIDAAGLAPTTTTVTTPSTTTVTTPPTTVTTAQEVPAADPAAPGTEEPAAPIVATQDLNLRAGPSRESAILAVIPAGSPVTPNGGSEFGYRGVTFAGTPGWADEAYLGAAPVAAAAPAPAAPAVSPEVAVVTGAETPLDPTPPAATAPVTVATALDVVNLRLEPSSDAAVLAVIPAGSPLSLTGESSSGFLGVSYDGQIGWVDAAYLA